MCGCGRSVRLGVGGGGIGCGVGGVRGGCGDVGIVVMDVVGVGCGFLSFSTCGSCGVKKHSVRQRRILHLKGMSA